MSKVKTHQFHLQFRTFVKIYALALELISASSLKERLTSTYLIAITVWFRQILSAWSITSSKNSRKATGKRRSNANKYANWLNLFVNNNNKVVSIQMMMMMIKIYRASSHLMKGILHFVVENKREVLSDVDVRFEAWETIFQLINSN